MEVPSRDADAPSKKHWQPVAYYSKKFSKVQANYDTGDREMLAIVECMKHWRHYCNGSAHLVRVATDHHNLKYFVTTKTLNARQGRCAEYLTAFDSEIEYKKGALNQLTAYPGVLIMMMVQRTKAPVYCCQPYNRSYVCFHPCRPAWPLWVPSKRNRCRSVDGPTRLRVLQSEIQLSRGTWSMSPVRT